MPYGTLRIAKPLLFIEQATAECRACGAGTEKGAGWKRAHAPGGGEGKVGGMNLWGKGSFY